MNPGELGWELYVNLGDLPALYDNLLANGQQFGLEHVGNRVINTLRIEKGMSKNIPFFGFVIFIL